MGQAACCQQEVDHDDQEFGSVHSIVHSSSSRARGGPLGEAAEQYSVPEAAFNGPVDEFTIRVDRTSGQELGVDVRHEKGAVMVVSEVAAGGLLRRWNDGHPVAAVEVGDRIVAVNGVRGNLKGMMAECEKKRVLEFTVQRRANVASDAARAACLAKHAALWVEEAYRMMGVDPMCGLEDTGAFVPAAAFNGSRPGYAFKMGASGLGYYREGTAAQAADVVGRAAGGPEWDLQARRSRRVCLTVHRDSVNDLLGMHVKHVGGQLVLVGIHSHGALYRSSSQSGARGGDTLEAGDVIVQVNEVRGDDAAMVRECEEKATLVIRALRIVG